MLILSAWLFATGSQWDLVQTFAWARMFSSNVRELPVDAALARTFSPEGRCDMCNAVTTAKQQQESGEQAPGGKVPGKMLLVYLAAPAVVITVPAMESLAGTDVPMPGLGRTAPPVPPPRA